MKIKSLIFLNIIVLVVIALVVAFGTTRAQDGRPDPAFSEATASPTPCCPPCEDARSWCDGNVLWDCSRDPYTGLCVYVEKECGIKCEEDAVPCIASCISSTSPTPTRDTCAEENKDINTECTFITDSGIPWTRQTLVTTIDCTANTDGQPCYWGTCTTIFNNKICEWTDFNPPYTTYSGTTTDAQPDGCECQ